MVSVFISADMEGIAGVVDESQVVPGRRGYDAACRLMLGELNAAVRGSIAGGADSVLVNDAHGSGLNICIDGLDEHADLISGSPKIPFGMMEGVSEDIDCCLFIGYHAAAGAESGVLAHTIDPWVFSDVRVNGRRWSEASLNFAIADAVGAPVVLLTGDRTACQRAVSERPNIFVFETKVSRDYSTARCVHPRRSRENIEALASRAVSHRPRSGDAAFRVDSDVAMHVCVRFVQLRFADVCSAVPGAVRENAWEVSFECNTAVGIRRRLQVCSLIAHGLLAQSKGL